MRVLVVGSGGREHAIVRKAAASSLVDEVHAAPGNGGIARQATCHFVSDADISGIVELAGSIKADLTVVGPEAPLVAGMTDALEAAGFTVFGPRAEAARLEGSKGFAKEIMNAAGVPTAGFATFVEYESAMAHLATISFPTVVKADGLAAGKGVMVVEAREEAEAAIRQCFVDRAFGDAGLNVLVEECLVGHECSVLALCDGETILPLDPAQDYKRIFDGGKGPNTGGMGCYSPVPRVPAELVEEIIETVHRPTIEELKRRGIDFRGVLYAGLMLTGEGPKVLEFNVRFGDPECQPMMLRLESDLLEALLACAEGRLGKIELKWRKDTALVVVMATQGYPGWYPKGSEIGGLDKAGRVEGVTIFHAGTRAEDGRVVADGGRVLGITASARTVAQARKRAYKAVDLIRWPEGFCRRDIAWRAIKRRNKR